MRTHTAAYKEKINSMGREFDIMVSYGYDGDYYNIDENDVISAKIFYEGNILKSVMRRLELECKSSRLPQGAVVNVTLGVKVRDNEVSDHTQNYDYVDMGYFIVDKVEEMPDSETCIIKCADAIIYSMKDYEDMGITYPITVRDYLGEICDYLNIPFASENDTFANYDKVIPRELYLGDNGTKIGYTFRDVLDDLAEVTGSIIFINEDDELEVKYPTETDDEINDDYISPTNARINQEYGPINTIVLSRSADSDNYSLSQPSDLSDDEKIAIQIKDNQIMNFDDRASYVPAILNKLYGLQYCTNDFKSNGITYYEVGDIYTIDIDGMTYSCIMLNNEINISPDSGLYERIYADEPDKSIPEYTKSDKNEATAKLIVDGAEARILAEVDNGYATKASLELKIDKTDYDRIVSMLNASADIINLSGGSSIRLNTAGKLIISAGNFQLDANGNVTASGGTYTNITVNGGSITLNPSNFGQGLKVGTNRMYTIVNAAGTFHWNLDLNANTYMSAMTNTGDILCRNITASNIQTGRGIAKKDGNNITFYKAFSSAPEIVATPSTTTSGVIALKIYNVTKNGFSIMTGGTTNFGDVDFHYIAIGDID